MNNLKIMGAKRVFKIRNPKKNSDCRYFVWQPGKIGASQSKIDII